MKSKLIGIIGYGYVGSAAAHAMLSCGYVVHAYDLKIKNSKIEDLLAMDLIQVCVPTPQNKDGACDISIVEATVKKLNSLSFKGIVAIRSTFDPSKIDLFLDKYKSTKMAFIPEFLRERCSFQDAISDLYPVYIGTKNKEVYEALKEIFKPINSKFIMLSPSEAMLVKYFHNVLNACKVIFANGFYEVSKKLNANYSEILNGIKEAYGDVSYLDVNENLRGYAGACLPKDAKAFKAIAHYFNLPSKIFDVITEDNELYKKTVFPGMRL